MSIEQVAYRAYAEATGGRDGRAISSDGILDVELATPKELGGAGGKAPTPSSCLQPVTRPALLVP